MAEEQHPDWITAELRRAAVTERAPTHLRLRIDEMSRGRSRRPARRRVLIPAAVVIAAIVIVGLLVLPGGTPGGPTVAQAAALGAQPIKWSPPATATTGRNLTRAYARFADVRFPSGLVGGRWTFETWRITSLDGRRILTVYYSRNGQSIAYSIAASPTLRGQKPGFSRFTVTGRVVVSWQESNHSCLLSSADTSGSTLLSLARS
jgi:hypothetical protein